jgi:hypothetical protein
MITKTNLINSLDKLPENLIVDQVIDHIIFVEKMKVDWKIQKMEK